MDRLEHSLRVIEENHSEGEIQELVRLVRALREVIRAGKVERRHKHPQSPAAWAAYRKASLTTQQAHSELASTEKKLTELFDE